MLKHDSSLLESNSEQQGVVEKGSGCLTQLKKQGWNILAEDVSFPIAVISAVALENNARWMQEFSEKAHVKLAPHGKTTMAPDLFKIQLNQGCWGISLATVPQVINAYHSGIKRIILANQLIGTYHFKMIADILAKGDVEFYCFVDSIENIHCLGRYFSQHNVALNILLEIGVEGGRCGWRDTDDMDDLVELISTYKALRLSGVSFYEGVIHGDSAQEEIITFVDKVIELTNDLAKKNAFNSDDILITGAGSAWYDVVATQLVAGLDDNINFTAIIRPGCYLIHDSGIYQQAQQAVIERSPLACDISGELISSLTLWAYVHSVPEPGLAIVGLGKRDVAFDAGLPKPRYFYQVGSAKPTLVNEHWQVTQIMDQHCMVKVPANEPLKAGDLICFSTSHPCLTMDKWRHIGIVDENFIVRRTIATYF